MNADREAGAASPVINLSAVEPLFAPHEEPMRHRARGTGGGPARVANGRRPSPIALAQTLRAYLREWRETDYPGASDTTRELLGHWFLRDHTVETAEGDRIPFRYYFCQREAVETLIYLYEVRGLRSLLGVLGDFGGESAEILVQGVDPDADRWAKYAFKVATGAGKTKVMSLAVVWSYFHALRESDSPMARHFVVVAPNLTVFERLKTDFKPAEGGKDIFDTDPLIPVAWRGDWNLTVTLQDDAGGAATGGALYLTNIHRLYDPERRRGSREAEVYNWMGPAVSKAKALDTGEALRARVAAHPRIMVLNDEAHHLWDADSAWNEAIASLHDAIAARGGDGVVAQLDFSATPKDNRGQAFQHVVCDTPLGEAVDGGIVKTPIIGRGRAWTTRASDDASEKFEEQLLVGYERWKRSNEEWKNGAKKPLLFVMTENTEAADQITRRLDSDSRFAELNGKTVNLHTNLKGRIRWIGGKKNGYPVFEESEKEINDEDLRELRRLSRELDSGQSPYQCIVSVLMLREGWDVRNVTTIVPLRPYSSKANILPEQTLGRGLRRMTPPGGAAELVTVVEHPAFVRLYQEQLEQEGLFIEIYDVEKVPKSTVTIFPDSRNKDLKGLDIVAPAVSAGYARVPTIEGLGIEDVRKQFAPYGSLPPGEVRAGEIAYEGRHLITDEIVERMNIQVQLLQSGVGAISYYREELEHITNLRGAHAVLAPLLETFITEILFGAKVDIFDPRLLHRIGDADVRERIRATFVPLILKRTTQQVARKAQKTGVSVATWKPFQATHSAQHPAIPARRTVFNLVPCNRDLEVALTEFLDRAPDVTAFCKNAGPQALRLDYMTYRGQLALYTPDFLARLTGGACCMVESKGRVDQDVSRKARAAIAFCETASKADTRWNYVYVPQSVFESLGDARFESLKRACNPSLKDLISEAEEAQLVLPFDRATMPNASEFISDAELATLPETWRSMITQAVALLGFLRGKKGLSFAPVFTPLLRPLDDACRVLMIRLLGPSIPVEKETVRAFFEPGFGHLSEKDAQRFRFLASNARRTLVEHSGTSPICMLRDCLEYAGQTRVEIGGFFKVVREGLGKLPPEIIHAVNRINSFRNTYVAHQKKPLDDAKLAREALMEWLDGLGLLWKQAQAGR